MTVLPTNGCKCATCEYLRNAEKAAAPTLPPLGPAPLPMPIVPAVPQPFVPPSDWTGAWTCGCGARVGNMHVHTCPFGVWCGHMMVTS